MATKAGSNSRTSRTRNTRVEAQALPKKPRSVKQKATGTSAASERFVKDLLVRGEATEPDQKGKLPLEATHAVTKKEKDGTAVIRRARFKYY